MASGGAESFAARAWGNRTPVPTMRSTALSGKRWRRGIGGGARQANATISDWAFDKCSLFEGRLKTEMVLEAENSCSWNAD